MRCEAPSQVIEAEYCGYRENGNRDSKRNLSKLAEDRVQQREIVFTNRWVCVRSEACAAGAKEYPRRVLREKPVSPDGLSYMQKDMFVQVNSARGEGNDSGQDDDRKYNV